MDRLLENDLAVKILSVILAVILWFQVAGEVPQTQKPVRGVAVRVRNLPPDMAVAAIEPDTVTVYVRGRSRDLSALKREDLEAWVDLRGARPGRLSYTVDGVNVPKGITLADFAPAEVTVEILPVVEREFTVTVELEGQPAVGFRVGPPGVMPPKVVLRGVARNLDAVAAVKVGLRLDGARETVTATRPVQVVDRQGLPVTGVTVAPQLVKISVPVDPAPGGSQP